jgi:RHS repeat-associated protein
VQPARYFNTTYTYDAAKRLTNLTSGAGTYSYYYHSGLNSLTTPSRLIQRISLPNTSYITNQFDSLARLTDTALTQSGGTIINRHAYAYNNGHQRTNQTRLDGRVDYLYDDAGQLYSAKAYDAGGAPVTTQNRGYLYDAAWNLNQRTNNVTVTTFNVNNLNQLTGGGYSHDGNGNMTARSSGSFAYDDENQLIETIPSSVRFVHTYDGKGRLRKTLRYNPNGTGGWVQAQGGETTYIYDGMLIVQIRGSATVNYTRGLDLSGSLEGAGGIGGLLGRSDGSTHTHYHSDGNGNITMLLNSAQSSVASYKYDPYGNTITSSGTLATANPFRFSSKLFHSDSALYYYGYRWYAPNLQRWLNRDPIEEEGGINLYCFVLNRPTQGVDAFGNKVVHVPFEGMDLQVHCEGGKAKCISTPLTGDRLSGPDQNPFHLIVPANTRIGMCADEKEVCIATSAPIIVYYGGTTLSKICFNADGSFKNSDIKVPWPISQEAAQQVLADKFKDLKEKIAGAPKAMSALDCLCK